MIKHNFSVRHFPNVEFFEGVKLGIILTCILDSQKSTKLNAGKGGAGVALLVFLSYLLKQAKLWG